MQLKSDLITIKKGSDSMHSHFNKSRSIAFQLSQIDRPLPNEDLDFHILQGLHAVFYAFKTFVNTRQLKNLNHITSSDLLGPLLSEEARIIAESQEIFHLIPHIQIGHPILLVVVNILDPILVDEHITLQEEDNFIQLEDLILEEDILLMEDFSLEADLIKGLVEDLVAHKELLSGPVKNGLYDIQSSSAHLKQTFSTSSSSVDWHKKLGHPAFKTLKHGLSYVTDIIEDHLSSYICGNCQVSKVKLGGEYRNVSSYIDSCGIGHRVSCPHVNQQNGKAEKKHRHIIETGLALLSHGSLLFSYCSYAFETEPRSVKCMFLGSNVMHKGYRCLNPLTNKLIIFRHVIFAETEFPYPSLFNTHSSVPHSTQDATLSTMSVSSIISNDPDASSNMPSSTFVSDSQDQFASNTSLVRPVQIATNTSLVQPVQNAHPMHTRGKSDIPKPEVFAPDVQSVNEDITVPTSFTASNKIHVWEISMCKEINSLLQNGTWILVAHDPSQNIV
ncbi:uncharacterized protein LOC113359797 [Papaver somniferum]|uniref:uncharacterized protein LOC113359797 n=1 Tax=Papaver somniferum TaxID=3469 RepID=UPI000E703BA0|nr:uncharacterized protein LOC113359797 [Papaver somniferum]